MKTIIAYFIFALTLFSKIEAQNAFHIAPIIGTRLHQDQQHGYLSYKLRNIHVSPLLGLEITHDKYPFVLNYKFNYYLELNALRDSFLGRAEFGIGAKLTEHQVDLFYKIYNKQHKEFMRIGVGHYWVTEENPISHSPFSEYIVHDLRGISLTATFPLKWLNVELKQKLDYSPSFAVLDRWLRSVNFIYNFNNKNQPHSNNSPTLNFLIGGRLFPITYEDIGTVHYNNTGIAAQFGLEFYVPKLRMSFNIERDWWLAINAGYSQGDIKGLISTSVIGLRYHQPLKNTKTLKLGLGATFITDNYQLLPVIATILAPGSTPDPSLYFYNLKGLSASISYPIYKKIDVEFRHTFVLKGTDKYSAMRNSLGFIYRLDMSSSKSVDK